MSVTDSSVERTEEVIVEDPTITLRFLALELDVRYGSAHAIAHEQLGRSKRYARWVSNQLTIEQKEQRVATGRNWWHEFEANGPQRFSDVVTGDECWISFFTMKDKRSNMVWLAEHEPRPEVLKTGFRSRKRMFTIFFNIQVPVIVDIMPDKAMITAHIIQLQFCKSSSAYLVTARTRRRSLIQLHQDNAVPHKAGITDVP